MSKFMALVVVILASVFVVSLDAFPQATASQLYYRGLLPVASAPPTPINLVFSRPAVATSNVAPQTAQVAVPSAGSPATTATTGTATAAGATAPAQTPVFIPSAQFHAQNELGAYNYGYVSGDGQGKNEIRADDGTVAGTYAYVDTNGLPVQVSYSAGPRGFQASGLHLPQSVALPEANVRAEAAHMAAKAIVAAKEAKKNAEALLLQQQQQQAQQIQLQQQPQQVQSQPQPQQIHLQQQPQQQQTYVVQPAAINPAQLRLYTTWG